MLKCFESRPKDFNPLIEVSAIYVESKGSYLLLEIGAHKAEANKWGVPCGKHDSNELPISAAVRELFEETGIKVDEEDLSSIGTLYFRKPEIDYVYHAYSINFNSYPEINLSCEHQGYRWATPEEAKKMPLMKGAIEALDFILKPRLVSMEIQTPIGPMLAVADEERLYLLEFQDHRNLNRRLEKLKRLISEGQSKVLSLIKKELALYFEGKLKEFKTPLYCLGTPFQNKVWEALQKIPFGETRSYMDIAKEIGHPSSFRAVARANGSNAMPIIIPCHRVIYSDGTLGGYGGGLDRKQYLLRHEKLIDFNR